MMSRHEELANRTIEMAAGVRVSNIELRVYGERERAVCLIRDIIILIPRADGRTDGRTRRHPLCNAVRCARI